MALITCPTCKKMISDLAATCGYCGKKSDSGNCPTVREKYPKRELLNTSVLSDEKIDDDEFPEDKEWEYQGHEQRYLPLRGAFVLTLLLLGTCAAVWHYWPKGFELQFVVKKSTPEIETSDEPDVEPQTIEDVTFAKHAEAQCRQEEMSKELGKNNKDIARLQRRCSAAENDVRQAHLTQVLLEKEYLAAHEEYDRSKGHSKSYRKNPADKLKRRRKLRDAGLARIKEVEAVAAKLSGELSASMRSYKSLQRTVAVARKEVRGLAPRKMIGEIIQNAGESFVLFSEQRGGEPKQWQDGEVVARTPFHYEQVVLQGDILRELPGNELIAVMGIPTEPTAEAKELEANLDVYHVLEVVR